MQQALQQIETLLKATVKHFPYGDTFKGGHHLTVNRQTGKLNLMIFVAELGHVFWVDIDDPKLPCDPKKAVMEIRRQILKKYPGPEAASTPSAYSAVDLYTREKAAPLLQTDSFDELLASEKKDPEFRAVYAEVELREFAKLVDSYLGKRAIDGRRNRKELRDKLKAECVRLTSS